MKLKTHHEVRYYGLIAGAAYAKMCEVCETDPSEVNLLARDKLRGESSKCLRWLRQWAEHKRA